MKTIMDELKEILNQPGWNDQVAEEFERVQILDEGAADADEQLDTCKHLHLLSILCRKGRKVGFSDSGDGMSLSAQAAVLAFKRCLEICEPLKAAGNNDFRLIDQLIRSYYGIAELLSKSASKAGEKKLPMLQEAMTYARKLHDTLAEAVASGADEQTRDFAQQFVFLSDMLTETITDKIQAIEGK
jgi:hypothetical protein